MDELRDKISRVVSEAMWNREKISPDEAAERILAIPEIIGALTMHALVKGGAKVDANTKV